MYSLRVLEYLNTNQILEYIAGLLYKKYLKRLFKYILHVSRSLISFFSSLDWSYNDYANPSELEIYIRVNGKAFSTKNGFMEHL